MVCRPNWLSRNAANCDWASARIPDSARRFASAPRQRWPSLRRGRPAFRKRVIDRAAVVADQRGHIAGVEIVAFGIVGQAVQIGQCLKSPISIAVAIRRRKRTLESSVKSWGGREQAGQIEKEVRQLRLERLRLFGCRFRSIGGWLQLGRIRRGRHSPAAEGGSISLPRPSTAKHEPGLAPGHSRLRPPDF